MCVFMCTVNDGTPQRQHIKRRRERKEITALHRTIRSFCTSSVVVLPLVFSTQAYALLLVEEEDRRSKETELGGRAEQLELMCRKNAYLQDKVSS